ncbi:two-component regulator propeller domain-containing protein [candidate division KSB1 bacterium]
MIKRLIKIFILTAAFYSSGYPQTLPFTSYTVEDGLPHSTVYSVLQDSKGFLWLGTQGGLSKFNGKSFENFFVREETGKSWIWVCFEDSRNDLWFGTNFGGLLKYDGKDWSAYSTDNGFIDNTVRAVYEDESGALWFGTRNGIGILKDGEWDSITTGNGLVNNLINGFLKDSKGRLWIATDGGVSCYDGGQFVNYTSETGLLQNTVWNVFEDTKGEIWILSLNGISIFNEKEWRSYTIADGLPGRVRSMLQTGDNEYWIGTRRGIVNFNGRDFKLYSNENGLVGTIVHCLYRDREDNIWIGCRGGISKLPSNIPTVSFTSRDGLVSNIVSSIIKDKDDNVWFSTNLGISRFDGLRWQNYTQINGERLTNIRCSFRDSKDNLWFGTSRGVLRFDGSRWRRIIPGTNAQNVINDIAEESNGDLWIGTRGGVFKYNGSDFTLFTEEDGIGSSVVRSVLIDNDGVIWCATRDGVSKFIDGAWERLTVADGLAGNNTNSIYLDSKNNIWIGTRNGVSRYDGENFTNFSMQDGLSSNICLYVIEENGQYYFGTNNGLNRFNGSTVERIYGEKDGFPSSVMNQQSVLADDEGNLWLGTINGAVKFNPSRENPLLNPPPVYINKVLLFKEEVNTAGSSEFDHEQNGFTFDFIGICMSVPGEVSYKYMLEGIDEDWNFTSQNTVEYAQLPPNSYTFKVHAKNADGMWSIDSASYSFKINPPFWATMWFRLTVVLSVFALIYLRLYYLKKSNIELENKVRERTNELEVKVTEIEESSRKIKTLEGLLPICCNCKKIKLEGTEGIEQADWIAIESYLKSRTEADFSHGICPDCRKKLYPDL